jgi:thioredoxin-related protein
MTERVESPHRFSVVTFMNLPGLFRSLLTWLVLAPLMAAPAWAATGDAFFDTTFGDYRAELQAARQHGKRGVLLVFEMEGCPYCRRMREQVYVLPKVQQYFRQHFAIFTVDMFGSVPISGLDGKETTEKAFANSLKVRGTPTYLFINVDGKEMARFTGATRDAEEFMALGRYVVDGHWQKTSFEQFRSAK